MRILHKALSLSALAAALAAPPLGVALAKESAKTVKQTRPNLTAAQSLVAQALNSLDAAEKANEYDTEGRAQKARELLKTASDEIKLAAEVAKDNPARRTSTTIVR